MFRSVHTNWLLLLLLVLFSGCSARRILREPDYGIVAIPYNSNAWPVRLRDQADELMTEHFPHGYQIVKEEEYVIGQTTHYDHEDTGTAVDIIDDILSVETSRGQTTATTTPKTEYRIHYVPRSAAVSQSPAGSSVR